ncbi:hypothetical protein DSECCO2_305870 [anaerobic digester metagenome]
MSDENSLLEQVHEKERELSTRYEQACATVEAAREAVVRERQGRLELAEREAREAVDTRWRSVMVQVDDEVEQIRRDADEREKEFRLGVEDRVPDAVEELVRLVAPRE